MHPHQRLALLGTLALGATMLQCKAGSPDSVGQPATQQADSTSSPIGNFISRVCEPFDATTYQVRHYQFGLGTATATWDRFSDPSCAESSRLMTIVMSGTSKVDGLSATVLGAADITVSIASKTITPTAAGVPVLQAACAGYPWQADSAQAFTTGCGVLLQQTDDCPAEYDLLKLTLQGLFFGDRSHPICSEATRPTMLSQWSVVPDLDPQPDPPVSDATSADAGAGDDASPNGVDASAAGDAAWSDAGPGDDASEDGGPDL